MIEPVEIIAQLQELLPKFTDKFHDSLAVTGASSVSNVLTLTIPNHSILVGQQVLINEAIIRNKINSVVLTLDNTLLFETVDDHDLTAYMIDRLGRNWPEGKTVNIENLQVYDLEENENGVQPPKGFETKEGYPLPTLSGNEFLLENRSLGAKGFQIVDSVTANTITINLLGVPPLPDGDLIINEIITNIRVAMAPEIERAEKMYTSQDPTKYWLFLIMTDRDVSKDKDNEDDFDSLAGSELKLLNIIENFSTIVFAPTNNEVGATTVQNEIYVNIFKILLSCLYGWKATGFTGDGISKYNSAYYAHSFDWQVRDQINYENGWENTSSVAFRILDFTQEIFDQGISDAEIEL